MQLILTVGDELSFQASKTTPDEHITFDNIFATLLSALTSYSQLHLDAAKEEMTLAELESYENDLYDRMDTCFGNFLKNVFPGIEPSEFDLSDAAIVYAQDQIINKALEEGKTWEEVKELYENLAVEYINARKVS